MTTDAGAPRWRGQAGRMEVWYATLTDRETGAGVWVHAEAVAPTDGGNAFGHGWMAVFPADDADPAGPSLERFGPSPLRRGAATADAATWFDAAECTVTADRIVGPGFDLAYTSDQPTLYTFPRLAWERELLPGAQVVTAPAARFNGKAGPLVIEDAVGAVSHIYGHGNAQRWGWLHADLGDGDVLEVVSAVSLRPGLNKLRPMAMVQLRRARHGDWPSNPAFQAPLLKTRLDLPTWTVTGRGVQIEVTIPEHRAVKVDYADPDGEPAVCVNSERADARITIKGQTWDLRGTAHAEVGYRGSI